MLIYYTHALLGDVTRRSTIIGVESIDNLKGQGLMLANHEETAARVQLAQKCAGTKIAIGNPQIIRRDYLEHRPQQRALLRMPIFTRKDIGDQAVGWLIDHERLAGQSPPGGVTQG